MRGAALFVAGIVVGMFAMQPSAAQEDKVLALNHVGINVKNLDDALNFYTKTLGFREAFSVRDQNGRPTLTYLQISRDTFLELQPASADRPAGFTHFGLQFGDLQAAVRQLKQRNVKVEDPRVGRTNAPLTNITDPDGVRIELLEYPPESLQRKAMESWK